MVEDGHDANISNQIAPAETQALQLGAPPGHCLDPLVIQVAEVGQVKVDEVGPQPPATEGRHLVSSVQIHVMELQPF